VTVSRNWCTADAVDVLQSIAAPVPWDTAYAFVIPGQSSRVSGVAETLESMPDISRQSDEAQSGRLLHRGVNARDVLAWILVSSNCDLIGSADETPSGSWWLRHRT
jgi:hypothetical protein